MNKETVVGAFIKLSSGRRVRPIHSILYIIVEPTEEVKKRLGLNSYKDLGEGL